MAGPAVPIAAYKKTSLLLVQINRMTKTLIYAALLAAWTAVVSCHEASKQQSTTVQTDSLFNGLQQRFLDAYWKTNPPGAIFAGYGKYYDRLIIPDSNSFAESVAFSRRWLDSLAHLRYDSLSDNNKINYEIIRNQLLSVST